MGHPKKDDDQNTVIIIAVLLILAGIVLFMKPSLITGSKDSASIPPQETIDKRINRNLKAADVKRQLEELKVRIANEKAAHIKAFEESRVKMPGQDHLKVEQESHGEQVMKNLEQLERRNDDKFMDPADVVERRIAREQAMQDYEEKYEKEYIRTFLRNAREQGLQIELNEDLEVINILDAPMDEPMRFPNSTGGSGGAAQ